MTDNFRILVDGPAHHPALGFGKYAEAFAEIICDSPPRFAIGIFGGWGSGKTTLMRAIESRIEDRDDVIPVWFNAWRYEREQQLIIPLLDVLRETLQRWSDDRAGQAARADGVARWGRKTAAAMGIAARAIASGVTLSAGLPAGLGEARLDLDKVLSGKGPGQAGNEPASIYHASFRMLAQAVHGFVHADGSRRAAAKGPQRRIVVFIDDLDRCLPLNALGVLESMKLFFDLEGFVFVVGLDQDVIERAIELRYGAAGEAAADGAVSANGTAPGDAAPRRARTPLVAITGRDYIKKIFQVPFALPPIDRSQLPELVGVLVERGELRGEQAEDAQRRVVEHLRYYSDGGDINAREIKRIINAYALQAKLLSLKLGEVDLDTVLALQVIAFRPDWERIWQRLEADPDGFIDRLAQGLHEDEGEGSTVWVGGEPIPPRLVDYLTKGPASRLTRNTALKSYLSSSQASHTSEPEILRAQSIVEDLRRFVVNVDDGTDRARLSAALHEKLDRLRPIMTRARWAGELQGMVSRLEQDAKRLIEPSTPLGEWSEGFCARLDRLDTDLREMRDRFSLLSS